MYPSARSTQMPMGISLDGGNFQREQQSAGTADQHMCGRAMDAITLHVGPDNTVTVTSGGKPSEVITVSGSRDRIGCGGISRTVSPKSAKSTNSVGASALPAVPGISGYRILGQSGQLSDRQAVAIQNGLSALANMLGGIHEQAGPEQTRLLGQLIGRDQQGQAKVQSFQLGSLQQSGLPRSSISGAPPSGGVRVSSGTAVLGAKMERLNLGGNTQPYSVMRGPSRPEVATSALPAQKALVPRTPIVLSQTVDGNSELIPQMQDLIRKGVSGYTASVAVVLMPNDNKLY